MLSQDRRRLRELEKLVQDGDLTIDDVRQIASDPAVCFATALVERGKALAKARRQTAYDVAQAVRKAADNAHQTNASNLQKQRVDEMRQVVEQLPASDLESLCAVVAARLPSAAIRDRVLVAVRARALDLPHLAAALFKPYAEWREKITTEAPHA